MTKNIDFKPAYRTDRSSYVKGSAGERVNLWPITEVTSNRDSLQWVASSLADIAALSGPALRKHIPIIDKYAPSKHAIRESARIKPARRRLKRVARMMEASDSNLFASVVVVSSHLAPHPYTVLGIATQLGLDRPPTLQGRAVDMRGYNPELFTAYWTDPLPYAGMTEGQMVNVRSAVAEAVTRQAIGCIAGYDLRKATPFAFFPEGDMSSDLSSELATEGIFIPTGVHGVGWDVSGLRKDIDYGLYVPAMTVVS